MMQNPKHVNWTNPVTATDLSGKTVPWDPNTDEGGIALQIDGGAPVIVPVLTGAITLDLTTVPAYMTLPNGQHTIAIADVTKEGGVGDFAAPITFLITTLPAAPTAVSLS